MNRRALLRFLGLAPAGLPMLAASAMQAPAGAMGISGSQFIGLDLSSSEYVVRAMRTFTPSEIRAIETITDVNFIAENECNAQLVRLLDDPSAISAMDESFDDRAGDFE